MLGESGGRPFGGNRWEPPPVERGVERRAVERGGRRGRVRPLPVEQHLFGASVRLPIFPATFGERQVDCKRERRAVRRE